MNIFLNYKKNSEDQNKLKIKEFIIKIQKKIKMKKNKNFTNNNNNKFI